MNPHNVCRRVPTRLARQCLPDFATSVTSSSTATVLISTRSLATGRISNPFRVLGLPPNASFETVKKTFVKLAMQHHPDTSSSSETSGEVYSSEKFVAIRSAFEQIRHEHNRRQLKPSRYNGAEDDEDGELEHTEEDFLNWFHDLTGVRLTSDQRREMVDLYWKQHQRNGGNHSHGHSWDLARRLVSLQDVFLRNRGRRNPAMATDKGNKETPFAPGPALRRKRPTKR